MTFGPWLSAAEFEAWWKKHGDEFRRLSVADPEEYERGMQVIEKFQHKRYLD